MCSCISATKNMTYFKGKTRPLPLNVSTKKVSLLEGIFSLNQISPTLSCQEQTQDFYHVFFSIHNENSILSFFITVLDFFLIKSFRHFFKRFVTRHLYNLSCRYFFSILCIVCFWFEYPTGITKSSNTYLVIWYVP